MSTPPAMKNYPVAQHHAGKATPLLGTGTGIAGAAKSAAPKKGEKKRPPCTKHSGRVLVGLA
jgi:hypothetical protein